VIVSNVIVTRSLFLHEKQLFEIQKKDPPILTMDEMKDSVAAVKALSDILQVDKKEAEAINEEESLLNWLPTPFTELYNMLVTIEPFEKLWNTVLQFHVSYDLWYYGKERAIGIVIFLSFNWIDIKSQSIFT
jgi:hypothetical protein